MRWHRFKFEGLLDTKAGECYIVYVEPINFDSVELREKSYGGRDEKIAVFHCGKPGFLKYQNDNMVGYLRQNHFAEYAASHIFTLCGFEAQQTLLGAYQGRNCVYCEDFVGEDEELWTLEKVLGTKRSLCVIGMSRACGESPSLGEPARKPSMNSQS